MYELGFADLILRKLDTEIETLHKHMTEGMVTDFEHYQRLRFKADGVKAAKALIVSTLGDNN